VITPFARVFREVLTAKNQRRESFQTKQEQSLPFATGIFELIHENDNSALYIHFKFDEFFWRNRALCFFASLRANIL